MNDANSVHIVGVEVQEQQYAQAIVYTGENLSDSAQTSFIGPFYYDRGKIKPLYQIQEPAQTGETEHVDQLIDDVTNPPSKSYKQTRLNFSSTASSAPGSSSHQLTTVLNENNTIDQTSVKKFKSKVWMYFEYFNVTKMTKCLVYGCNTQLKGNHVTNMRKHLKAKHNQIYLNLIKEEAPAKPEEKKQPTLVFDKKYPLSNPKQLRFLKKLTWWVAANPVSNSVIENAEFIEMIREADPKLTVPSRPTMEKTADLLFEEAVKKVMELLDSMRRFTILSDIWTKKGYCSSFLGVSITGYNHSLKKKINLVLSVKKFESITHTAADVLSEMNRVSTMFELKPEKVWRAMTDGGSEMVSSHRNQNLFLQNLTTKDREPVSVHNCVLTEGQEDELPFEAMGVVDDELEIVGVSEYRRIPCFIHALLRCLCQIENDEQIQNLLKKMREAMSVVTTSSKKTQLLIDRTKTDQKPGIKLLTFNNTRKWNVNYLVATRLLRVQVEFSKILEEFEMKKDDLTELEWNNLLILKEFLEPFFDSTNTSSREEDLISSFLIIQIKSLHEHLNEYVNSDFLAGAAKNIKDKMDEKFAHWIDYPKPGSQDTFEGSFLAATMFDPRYRCILSEEEKERAKWFIINEHSPFDLSNHQTTTPEPLQVKQVSSRKRKSVNTYLQQQKRIILEKKTAENSGAISNSLAEEMESFLVDPNFDFDGDDEEDIQQKNGEILQFWENQKKKYPLLSPLALDYLCLPTSTAIVEQTFSLAGVATRGLRNRLDGDHLDREVFLRSYGWPRLSDNS